jgi:hypothetical protein
VIDPEVVREFLHVAALGEANNITYCAHGADRARAGLLRGHTAHHVEYFFDQVCIEEMLFEGFR